MIHVLIIQPRECLYSYSNPWSETALLHWRFIVEVKSTERLIKFIMVKISLYNLEVKKLVNTTDHRVHIYKTYLMLAVRSKIFTHKTEMFIYSY